MTKLESQSKRYFFVLLFVLFFPNVVMFCVPFLVEFTQKPLYEYNSLIMTGANYVSRVVLLLFLYFDLRALKDSRYKLIIPFSALFVPFISAAIYFILVFLYKPENQKV